MFGSHSALKHSPLSDAAQMQQEAPHPPHRLNRSLPTCLRAYDHPTISLTQSPLNRTRGFTSPPPGCQAIVMHPSLASPTGYYLGDIAHHRQELSNRHPSLHCCSLQQTQQEQ